MAENERAVTQPLISVLMNCYNGEEYLRHALDSVISQTYENWELVFWDNRSTDKSADIVKEYSDPRIRYYLASEHTTLGLARVRASRHLRGEWIAVLDTDDYWLHDNLTIKVRQVRIEPHLGIVYSRYLVDRSKIHKNSFVGPRLRVMPCGFQYNRLSVKNFIGLNTVLYRKSAFIKVGGFNDYAMAADHDLSLRICKHYKIKGVNSVTSVYRVHERNYSRTKVNIMYNERLKIAKTIDKVFPRKRANARIVLDYLHSSIGAKKRRDINIQVRNFFSLFLFVEIAFEILERLNYEFSSIKKRESELLEKFKKNQ